jgi:transcriptional regulator with XRE-family HTH domain
MAGRIPTWTLGDRMSKALDDAGISRGEMARYLDVDRNTVGNYIHGRTRPNHRTLMLWALRTGVDLVWITSGDPDSVTRGHSVPRWFRGKAAKPHRPRPPHHGALFPSGSPDRVTLLRPTG